MIPKGHGEIGLLLLVAWIWAAYKLNDYLVYRRGMQSGTGVAVAFAFLGLLTVGYMNGGLVWGGAEPCYGAAHNSSC